jgi:transcriptional regulator with XRE-family HTH domain
VSAFGKRLKTLREAKQASNPGFSVRKFAKKVGVSPAWISRIETGDAKSPPSEEVIVKLAEELGENPIVLLALANRISSKAKRVILKRPELFTELLEELDKAPDHAIISIVREVRDGDW